MREIALWGAVVELLGLAAAPLLRAAFQNRRDAALLCRPVGLALVAWAAWALTLLPGVPFERRTLLIGAAAVVAASWAAGRAARRRGRDFAAGPVWGPDETRGALFFWAPAAVFLLIRACLPEIVGQEKFMDLAFLNSLVRNRAMPPLDPWMAGGTINYYYWGYLLAASLVRLSGVATSIAYNLAIATFAGYSFSAAACLGLRLSAGRWRAGIWSGFGAVFAGDLAGAFDAWKAPLGRGFDYWHASRVIGNGNTINEFPFFTFFQADLHPHLMAYPFFLAVFALGHRMLEIPSRPEAGPPSSRADRMARAWPALLLAFLAGTARAANNWTLPVLAILLVTVSVLRSSAPARLPPASGAALGLIRGAGLLLLSLFLWYPYSRSYSLPSNGLAWTTMKSGLFEFLFFWGILFVVAAVGLLGRLPPADEAGTRRRDLRLALAGAAGLLGALATGAPALLVLLPLLFLAADWTWSALRGPDPDPGGVYTGFLLLLGLSIVAGCEFVYFRDPYGTELQRMNTVFKFYHQAWPLLAIAAAVIGERAWAGVGASRRAVCVVLSAALVLALLYPADALLSRLRMHEGPFTLDARSALARRAPGDAEAIAWLDSHAPRGAVVLEATGDAYSEYARISSHTGIPTVLGWGHHEGLWRGNDREVADRTALIRAFYEVRDESAAALFLQRYRVTHVVLGDLERQRHQTADRIADYVFLTQELAGSTAVFSVHVAP
jgi:YYY domain-containing protein